MQDPVGRGIIAGAIGVIAINLVEVLLTYLKISETPLWQAGGIVFLNEDALKTPLGIAIGVFSHVFIALVIGVVIAYYIYYSGTDFAAIKGAGLSIIAGFTVLAIIFPLRGIAKEMQSSPRDVLSALIDHAVFGLLAGFIVKYLQLKYNANDSKSSDSEKKCKYVKVLLKRHFKEPSKVNFKKPKKI